MSDRELAMDRFLSGVERSAFRIARISTRHHDDALDIVQDAMIKLAQRYASRPPAEWKPLFYKILRNRIVDYQRRQTLRRKVLAWRSPASEDDYADPLNTAVAPRGLGPGQQNMAHEALQQLEYAVAQLAPRQQQAFLLRMLEDMSVADTARVMGCSEGSVKTHYSRAVHQLREALGDYWETPGEDDLL
ncbi:MAG: RNA polymerase sigma factor [Gammaproteobacteria bacterium]